MLHLNEYIKLLAIPGVQHKVGVQCPFGAESSKPTSWVYYGVDLGTMPTACEHPKRLWFSVKDGTAVTKRHKPTTGTTEYIRAVTSQDGLVVKPPPAVEGTKMALEAGGQTAGSGRKGTRRFTPARPWKESHGYAPSWPRTPTSLIDTW